MPFSACCRFATYVSIKKEYDGQGRNAALTALGADPFVKLAVIVDDDIDPYNETQVMWAVATRVRADKDVMIIPEAYTCELDPTAYSIEDDTQERCAERQVDHRRHQAGRAALPDARRRAARRCWRETSSLGVLPGMVGGAPRSTDVQPEPLSVG